MPVVAASAGDANVARTSAASTAARMRDMNPPIVRVKWRSGARQRAGTTPRSEEGGRNGAARAAAAGRPAHDSAPLPSGCARTEGRAVTAMTARANPSAIARATCWHEPRGGVRALQTPASGVRRHVRARGTSARRTRGRPSRGSRRNPGGFAHSHAGDAAVHEVRSRNPPGQVAPKKTESPASRPPRLRDSSVW